MSDSPKFGAGHLAAMGRAGLKEVGQALQAFPGQGIHGIEEPGLVGNLTPQEIVKGKGVEQSYDAMLSGYATNAKQAQPVLDQSIER